MYDREYSIGTRLNIHIDYEAMTARRFLYIADCVQRDIKKEEEAHEKRKTMLRRKGYDLI